MSKLINEQIAVMKAFAEGKAIEYKRYSDDKWLNSLGPSCEPSWNWADVDYRIAPKPLPEVGDVLMIRTSAGFNHDTVVIVWGVDEVNRIFTTYNQLDCYGDPLKIYHHKADDMFTVIGHIGK